jgi:hypothetical protein
MIKGIVIGFFLAIAILAGGFFYYFAAGLAPVATADPPMPFEKKLANMALETRILRSNTFPNLLYPRTNLIFLPVRTCTNSTAPPVTDFQGSLPQTMRQRCIRNRHNCSVVRV